MSCRHYWSRACHEAVGGCASNPGVHGRGGHRVLVMHACHRCGALRLTTIDGEPPRELEREYHPPHPRRIEQIRAAGLWRG